MRPTKTTTFVAAFAAALLSGITFASAQNAAPANGNNGGNGGGRRGGGNFDPTQFRQQMNERIKTALKASDDEWGVIQPLLEKVQEKQFAGRGGFGGFGGRRGGNNGGGGAAGAGGTGGGTAAADTNNNNNRQRGGSPESQALRDTLDNESSSADDIKAKLTALRDARKKNTAELEAARADLRKVLTLRQEATLVSMSILE